MTFIRFTSKVDPTWNGRKKTHKPVTRRSNLYNGRRDSVRPEEVCKWMNRWAQITAKNGQKPPFDL